MTNNIFIFYLLVFILSFTITAAAESAIIPILSKRAKQPIYTEGPKWHLKKYGTPTMGGVGFIIPFILSVTISVLYLFSAKEKDSAISIILCAVFCIANAAIGMIDDSTKLRRKENQGLTAAQKLILQSILATAFLIAREILFADGTEIHFAATSLDLGIFYYPVAFIAILGTVNCANLTDGIDGLASGVAFGIGLSLFYLSAVFHYDCAFLSVVIVGIALGFLLYNVHPAKIFMGDTGSLFFGAFAICATFTLGNPLLILPLGIVYLLEGVSVIIQVVGFKTRGVRIFKMAPVHHHLEKSGWSENKILVVGLLITVITGMLCYGFVI